MATSTELVALAHDSAALRAAAAARWRVALLLTITMIVVYFGFIALIAYRPDILAIRLTDGLTLGIVLGAAVILVSWLLTYAYVYWMNARYDTAVEHAERQP